MNEVESRVRCLELAASLNIPIGNYGADTVVKTATMLYEFVHASPPASKPAGETADKPGRGRPPKQGSMFD